MLVQMSMTTGIPLSRLKDDWLNEDIDFAIQLNEIEYQENLYEVRATDSKGERQAMRTKIQNAKAQARNDMLYELSLTRREIAEMQTAMAEAMSRFQNGERKDQ